MKKTIIGRRIKMLRTSLGLSQDDVAKKLKLSRSNISQMETGNININLDTLILLSDILNVSIDDLVNKDKSIDVILEEKNNNITKSENIELRINVPQKNVNKFKQIFLYLLSKVGAKSNVGETVIYKLLYFIDFDFYEKYEEQLIGATYIKNHHGPTPIEFKKIVEEMIENNEIRKIRDSYFKYPQTKYLPTKQYDPTQLKAHEKEIIDEVINRLSDMNAKQISDYSHGDIPWIGTENGKHIDYEAVFYRTVQYSVRYAAESDV